MASARKPPAKRGPGRPRKPVVTGPAKPQPVIVPDPITPPADDAAAQSAADRIAEVAAAAATPGSSTSGGRPNARQAGMNQLADNLATAYMAAGGALCVLAQPLAIFAPDVAIRLDAIGLEIQANATECGNALARWADTNPKVKAFLTGASGHAGMLMVVAVHLPIVGAAVGRPVAGRIAADVLAASDTAAGAGNVGDVLGGMGFGDVFTDLFKKMTQPGDAPVETTATEAPAAEPDHGVAA